ncbi:MULTISPECIES: formyltransferase family protein [unclassified Mesorhizobium]|uniref:formyltransferase family protein n=1 Tax=unclassified Mesorhizobium TaxID=325217 RepID=UPI00112BDFBC|nr:MULTISPECIES: formyltransferase family protein [unclassified Mesorhizobium]TPI50681.1 methionyl-tRNA formyltransferase [Mesorhizobium sp. B3-1-1]TPJ64953.1 methionyl-tRNA formyltransferase [Mesorhizobium sp. B2-6-7]TPJ80853.1 methionyl-tRNA formyltransferase [Mesorhizobium sp. B2-6-3]TPK02140.1 methionyl-tRNA formyltransferase [Mesorhizobium sp. B2-5-10]TPK05397.1 methionyl-tRNA formyltransferase [Mesorhizobium sp. B2-5-11]
MRIAFVGAVEGSRVAFDALVEAGMTPSLLVTLAGEASKRHSDFVDLAGPARLAGAAVHLTKDINAPDTIDRLEAERPDLTMVVGWSQICRGEFRSVARYGSIGFHPAPLPRFRGRAVIPWTIIANEKETGSTFFRLDEGVDSGPIVLQKLFAVAPDETARSLYDKHKQALFEMTPLVVSAISRDKAVGVAQDESLASYCAKRTADDGIIDWSDAAENVLRFVRAVGDPYPGAFTFTAGAKIVIDKARMFASPGRHIGLTGQVQTHTDSGFTVLCGDGAAIEVTSWYGERPRIHAKLASAGPTCVAPRT